MKKTVILLLTIAFFLFAILVAVHFLKEDEEWRAVEIELEAKNGYFSEEEMIEQKHTRLLANYTTEVSVCYENTDRTKSLYVFSSPINYVSSSGNLYLIDTRIANVKNYEMLNKGYYYTIADSDIRPYYPQALSAEKGIYIESNTSYEFGFFGSSENCAYITKRSLLSTEEKMLHYANIQKGIDLYTYPSSSGTNIQLDIKEQVNGKINAWLKLDDAEIKVEKQAGGYVAMKKRENNESVIIGIFQNPIIKLNNGEVCTDCEVYVDEKGSGLYYLCFDFGKDKLEVGTQIFLSFEAKRESQPDNAIYSKHPNLLNAYLSQLAYIGASPKMGLGRQMIRFKLTGVFNLPSERIISASYNMYRLTSNCNELEMLEITEDWCSVTGGWADYYKTGKRMSYLYTKENELSFDISEIVKSWSDDKTGFKEHCGLILKCVEENQLSDIFLTNDCRYFNNYTKVIFS